MFVILHILFYNNKAVFIDIAFEVFWVTVNGFLSIESVQLNQTVFAFGFKLPFQTVETFKELKLDFCKQTTTIVLSYNLRPNFLFCYSTG